MKKRFLALVTATVVTLSCCPTFSSMQITAAAADIAPMTAAPATPPIYQDESYSYEERAADMVARMTLAEKASQTAGYNSSAIPRLGIASYMWWNEALHGYSQEGWFGITTDGASYPSSYSMGTSWDTDLYYQEAVAIGSEIRERVKGNKYNLTMFSPTVNLARDPRWGRNDESYGEDPFLVGNMGASFVKGVEGKDINGDYIVTNSNGQGIKQAVTTIKHYAANNSEKNRYTSGADNVTQREMREYYTRPYRIVVDKADVSSVMMAYSSVNGIPISFSSFYMDTLLRQVFGFSGYIVSDCDSVATSFNRNVHKTNPLTASPYTLGEAYANAMASGLDLQCNAGETDGLGSYASNYKKMMLNQDGRPIRTDKGFFTEQQLDVSAHRLMTKRMQLGEFDQENKYITEGAARLSAGMNGGYLNGAAGQTKERIDLADELSRSTIVLLKNENNALPITEESIKQAAGSFKVGIIGPVGQSNFRGGYSSRLSNESNLVTIEQAIKTAFKDEATYNQAARDNLKIDYHYGYSSSVNRNRFTALDAKDIALDNVEENLDLAIVVVGQGSGDSREDGDRTDLHLAQAQVELIKQVKAKNPKKLILVMETYGPVHMEDGIVNNADAILWSSFNGFRKGTGFGEAITGKNNPSGRTNATWLKDMISDTPGFFDYSLYPSNNKGGRTYMYNVEDTIYPFGYGLSYADVAYAKADGEKSILGASAAGALDLGNGAAITMDSVIDVKFKISNTNNVDGKQVAQVYAVSPGAGTDPKIPLKRLVGFEKVEIAANGSETVSIPVKVSDLALYDEDKECYVLPAGEWTLWVARSSELKEGVDLSEKFTVTDGFIREDPSIVTVKPTQHGDNAKENGVSERVLFDLGTSELENTIQPNVAVTMANEKLYGTRVINNVPGKDIGVNPDDVNASTASWDMPDSAGKVSRIDNPDNLPQIGVQEVLPASYTIEYASNRPDVVQVGDKTDSGAFSAGPIVMKKAGVATITAKVTSPDGVSAETEFVVYVQGDAGLTDITIGGHSIEGFDGNTLHYSCPIVSDISADDPAYAVKAVAIDGVTVEYSATGKEGSFAPAPNGINPALLPGSVYIKVSGTGIAEQVYIVAFEDKFTSSSFVKGIIDDKWTVNNENKDSYTAVPGYGLKLAMSPGSISGTNRNWNNVFTRPGGGDWTITTKLYLPTRIGNRHVMLLAWEDEDNYIRVGYQGSNRSMSMAPEIGGASNGSISTATGIPQEDTPLVLYYKLQRKGTEYTAWYSEDGLNFKQVQSADGRRRGETSLVKNVQVGLFANGAAELDAYCEFIDITDTDGRTDQDVLNDAFAAVAEYLPGNIPTEISQDIKLAVPYDYTVKFESDSPYINKDGTLTGRPATDQEVAVKITLSHPKATVNGSSEVVVYNGPITLKASGTVPDPDYGVSKNSLEIETGGSNSFDLTMGSEAIKATIAVDDATIASVSHTNVTADQTVTVSALSKGETKIKVTWYGQNDKELGSKIITVFVAGASTDYGLSTDKLTIEKGSSKDFNLSMNTNVVMSAKIAVVNKDIASVSHETVTDSQTVTVSALKKGETQVKVTWYGLPNNHEIATEVIDVTVTEESTPVDKAALNALIAKASALTESDYTAESWAPLAEALAAAQSTVADNQATQETVDTAAAALQASIDGLVEAGEEVPVTALKITGSSTVKRNKTAQLAVVITPSNATDPHVTWTSLSPLVADVDENGLVTATSKTGFAIIQVTSANGVSAQFTIRVTA
ncbi:glycoside hydrolase family 3 C-terminal domain-containing protein [Oscillospiraceae bacterium MB08-C2-2]|nr:glycoside hydrolase family 3 C-terminal domain-containing protein [Oscillospiraceae bacterium MB08-C2-2]